MFTPHLTTKRRGEIAELCFLLTATRRGYTASKPWGDSDSYDSIVEGLGRRPGARHKLSRVQVRSAASCKLGKYTYSLTHGHTGSGRWLLYTPVEVDFFALYVEPEQLWYIIPIKEVAGKLGVALSPHGCSKYNKFREAWSLLGQPLRPSTFRQQYSVDFIPQTGVAADQQHRNSRP